MQVSLEHPTEGEKPRVFTFDMVYGGDSKQQDVYDECGFSLVENVIEGYNGTMFAYGQTGSGKSYSQFGYGANRGIIPVCADELFKRIDANTDPNITFQVSCRIIEIYQEKLQDLLVDFKDKGKKELKIRQ